MKYSRTRKLAVGWGISILLVIVFLILQIIPRTTESTVICDDSVVPNCSPTITSDIKRGLPIAFSTQTETGSDFNVIHLLLNISLAAPLIWLPAAIASFKKRS